MKILILLSMALVVPGSISAPCGELTTITTTTTTTTEPENITLTCEGATDNDTVVWSDASGRITINRLDNERIQIINWVLYVPREEEFDGMNYTCLYERGNSEEFVTKTYRVEISDESTTDGVHVSITEDSSSSTEGNSIDFSSTQEGSLSTQDNNNIITLPLRKEDMEYNGTILALSIVIVILFIFSTTVTVILLRLVCRFNTSRSYKPNS